MAQVEKTRLQQAVETYFYRFVIGLGVFGWLVLVFNYPSKLSALTAPAAQFGAAAVLFFVVSTMDSDQAVRFNLKVAAADLVETLLMFRCFYALDLASSLLRNPAPSPGLALVWLSLATFFQLLWRRLAGLENRPEHYDFRFLWVACLGFAYAAPNPWVRLVCLLMGAALLIDYSRRNQPPAAVV